MIYEKIYKKLTEILDDIEKLPETTTLKSNGFMDLHVEKLERSTDTSRQGHCHLTISLAHYHKQNGDLVPDPDMVVRVYPENKAAEAMSYQDSFGYREVYPEPGKVDVNAKKELNSFLNTFLSNLKAQGFTRKICDPRNNTLKRHEGFSIIYLQPASRPAPSGSKRSEK